MDNRPIGVFDSGVGGLTVVKQLRKEMPEEEIIYFGDTARVPYGSKSKETVTKFSRQIIRFLLSKDVKSIVVACNTVSSNSLEILQNEFSVPIFGVVEPGAKEAVKATKNKKVGVIGTVATIRSGAYQTLIEKQEPRIEVYQKACPLFTPLVEEGFTDCEISRLTIETYLHELLEKNVDSILLGCTHYPLLKKSIKKIVGEKIKLVDPAHATALFVKQYLKQKEMENQEHNYKEPLFYVSDLTETFSPMCEIALGQSFKPNQVEIDSY